MLTPEDFKNPQGILTISFTRNLKKNEENNNNINPAYTCFFGKIESTRFNFGKRI